MVRAASEMGWLFGSVVRDIAEGVTEAGFTIQRSQVIMNKSIKTLGLHDIRVSLHPEVSITVVVNVARSLDEAETQLKTGVAVTGGVQDIDDEPDAIAEAVAAFEEVEATEAATSEDDVAESTNTGDAAAEAGETAADDGRSDRLTAIELQLNDLQPGRCPAVFFEKHDLSPFPITFTWRTGRKNC